MVCAASLFPRVEGKMFSCFPTEEDILVVYKAVIPIKPKETTKFGLIVFARAVLFFIALKLSAKPTKNDLLLVLEERGYRPTRPLIVDICNFVFYMFQHSF